MTNLTLGRRAFLGGAAGLGLATAAAACASGSDDNTGDNPGSESGAGSSTGGSSAATLTMPAYDAYQAVKPDYLPSARGVEAGYKNYPANHKKMYPTPPGSGHDVTALAIIGSNQPIAMGSNTYWKELNKRVGATMKFTWAPSGQYAAKLATTVASGNMPDFTQIRTAVGELPNTPNVLKQESADLTEFLSGDAIKDYPGLANITSRSWESCVFNGGIYAVPIPRSTLVVMTFTRDDLLAKKGLDPNVKSADEFLTLCKEMTDEKKNQWATAAPLNLMYNIQEVFDTPNRWEQTDGKFECEFESPKMKDCLAFMRSMADAGVFHPDSFGNTPSGQVHTWFDNGTISIFNTGATGYLTYMKAGQELNPGYELGAIPPYDAHGGEGRTFSGPNIYSITAIKKGSKERVAELLRIADFMAAPFGTDEYTFLKYGIEGRHFNFDADGNPIATTEHKNERGLPTGYICSSPLVLYSPDYPDRVKSQHEFETNALKRVKDNDSIGLYSEANGNLWPALNKKMQDMQNDIISGRKPLSDWDGAVKDFQQNGGDKIRQELEKSWADTH